MGIVVTNTLHKREYLYYRGNIIYLDQLEEILGQIILYGMYSGYTVYKNRLFLYDQGVIDRGNILNKSYTLYGDAEQARQLYNKYFGRKSHHIINPTMKIHDAAISMLVNMIFPGGSLWTLAEKGIKRITHRGL